jgi:hypothetical protein
MPSLTIDTTVDINASRDAACDVLTGFANYAEWKPQRTFDRDAAGSGTRFHVATHL